MYLDHTLISVFLSSFAPLRLCVRYKNVVHLAENRCKLKFIGLKNQLETRGNRASNR
ncbi:hypothetical protein NIES3585_06400 [Nodularia sp. NIES-3585]|nr:hypothetical protein NIES3585_06400 [Nodularia sp. NIES-3585]